MFLGTRHPAKKQREQRYREQVNHEGRTEWCKSNTAAQQRDTLEEATNFLGSSDRIVLKQTAEQIHPRSAKEIARGKKDWVSRQGSCCGGLTCGGPREGQFHGRTKPRVSNGFRAETHKPSSSLRDRTPIPDRNQEIEESMVKPKWPSQELQRNQQYRTRSVLGAVSIR